MTNNEVNYQSLLSTSWDNVPKPRDLPVGSWRLRCKSASVQPPKSATDSAQLLFSFEPQEAMDDVNQDELAELTASGYDIAMQPIYHRQWLKTAGDLDKVRNLLAKLGVDTKGQTVGDSLKQAVGTDVIGYVNIEHFTTKAGQPDSKMVISSFVAMT